MQTALMTSADTAVSAVPACSRGRGSEAARRLDPGLLCLCLGSLGPPGAVAVEGPECPRSLTSTDADSIVDA